MLYDNINQNSYIGRNNMEYKYIIWDWNGTLLNDAGAAMSSVNDMLKERNMPPLDMKRYRECIGVPIIKFYEKVFDLENEDYEEILKAYNEGYLRHLENTALSDGAEEALEYFKSKGCTQLIVSSSNNEQLTTNIRKYGIYDYFDAILGASDYLATSKIDRAIKYLEKQCDGKVLVIGDLVHDAEMAKEIGADCILLSTGHEMRERLDKTGLRIIDSLKEIAKTE